MPDRLKSGFLRWFRGDMPEGEVELAEQPQKPRRRKKQSEGDYDIFNPALMPPGVDFAALWANDEPKSSISTVLAIINLVMLVFILIAVLIF